MHLFSRWRCNSEHTQKLMDCSFSKHTSWSVKHINLPLPPRESIHDESGKKRRQGCPLRIKGLLSLGQEKHSAAHRLLLHFRAWNKFSPLVTNQNHSFILTPQIPPLTDQLNKTDHLPTCWRLRPSELWLERLHRDILNNYGRSCLRAPEKQGDSL